MRSTAALRSPMEVRDLDSRHSTYIAPSFYIPSKLRDIGRFLPRGPQAGTTWPYQRSSLPENLVGSQSLLSNPDTADNMEHHTEFVHPEFPAFRSKSRISDRQAISAVVFWDRLE